MIIITILDEFAFINQIKPTVHHQPHLIKGIGDDAALYETSSNMEQIICMDTLVEDVHFSNKTMSAFQIGYKALAVNISDIAAMGGIPTFYLVSIAIPESWSEQDILAIYEGMASLAAVYKMDLIGGDTVSTKSSLMITVTVIGQTEKQKHLLRSSAKPGDILFVTGTLGDSAAGLELLLSQGKEHPFSSDEAFLVNRHQLPQPRVDIGRELIDLERVALNDISDGIASEANEIAEASQVSMVIEAESIPISKQLLAYKGEVSLELALFGGEDFELIGTMTEAEWMQCNDSRLTKIGTVIESTTNPKVFINQNGEMTTLEKKGYNHFKK